MTDTVALGSTDQQISRLGLGGGPLGRHGFGPVDESELIATVHHAVDLGVNFFDTADVYGLGESERLLCQALGNRRKDVVIATKFGVRWDSQGNTSRDISPTYLRKALEASLRRLQLDTIPLYYIHWPDNKTRIGDTVEELARFQKEGKIKWIGVSNFSTEQFIEAQEVAAIEATQLQLSLLTRIPVELISTAVNSNSTVVTWGSLAEGLLTGKYDANSQFAIGDRRNRYEKFSSDRIAGNLKIVELLMQISDRLHKTPAQIAIRWLLDTENVGACLVGAKRPTQLEENSGVFNWSLAEDDYRQLGDVAKTLGVN